MGIKAKTF